MPNVIQIQSEMIWALGFFEQRPPNKKKRMRTMWDQFLIQKLIIDVYTTRISKGQFTTQDNIQQQLPNMK